MSLSDAAAMPATSLPALALLAAISRRTEGECSTSCVAGCAAAAASALLWLGLLCSDLAAREDIKAVPLRDTERARIRAAFVMGSMVAAWMGDEYSFACGGVYAYSDCYCADGVDSAYVLYVSYALVSKVKRVSM